jgi:hypothetical protein
MTRRPLRLARAPRRTARTTGRHDHVGSVGPWRLPTHAAWISHYRLGLAPLIGMAGDLRPIPKYGVVVLTGRRAAANMSRSLLRVRLSGPERLLVQVSPPVLHRRHIAASRWRAMTRFGMSDEAAGYAPRRASRRSSARCRHPRAKAGALAGASCCDRERARAGRRGSAEGGL